MLKKRDRGTDHILSRSFKTVSKTGNEYLLKTIEKRINLKGKGGFTHKVVTRNLTKSKSEYYSENKSILATMSWHYNNGQITRWERYRTRDPRRVRSTKVWKPPQENYFCYNDIEVGIPEEKHKFLNIEEHGNNKFIVVKSVPIKQNLKYSKRLTRINAINLTPVRYEYYDKKEDLWQTIDVEWQNKFGILFWKKAEVINVRTGNKTIITVDDVRVNIGLPAIDFMSGALFR
jgi:hypothetical protein